MGRTPYWEGCAWVTTRSTRLDAGAALIDEVTREDGDGIGHRVERHADRVYGPFFRDREV